jgi:hypothetical protein
MRLPMPRTIVYELEDVYEEEEPLGRPTTCLCGKRIPKGAKRLIAVYSSSEGFWNLYRLVHDPKCAPEQFSRASKSRVSEAWYDAKRREAA